MLVIAVFGWCVEKWFARKQRKQQGLGHDGSNGDAGSLEMNGGHQKEVSASVHSAASLTPPPPRY